MATDGGDRGAKASFGIGIQSQRNNQSLSGISVRVRGASFQFLDPVHTQASALGELLLRQPGRLSIPAEHFAETANGASEHRRRQTITDGSNPPACTPAWE
jgi:hypothetical protein